MTAATAVARRWRALTLLGVEATRPSAVRGVVAANTYFLIATLGGLAWSIALAFTAAPAPHPALTNLALALVWASCLWISARGAHCVAAVVGLAAPIVEYTYLAAVYGRDAEFHMLLLTIPPLVFVVVDVRRAAVRVVALVVTAAALAWTQMGVAFEVPRAALGDAALVAMGVINIATAVIVLAVVAAFNDTYLRASLTRAAARVSEAREAAETDPLTGALNRRGIEPIAARLARGSDFAVALLDIDRFKRVNDELGHAVGDVVLAGVARTLTRELAGRGHFARWGGEEFIVVTRAAEPDAAVALVEELRDAVEREYADADAISATITLSAGVAVAPARTSLSSALDAADDALYEAKEAGRNRVMARVLPADRRPASRIEA